LIILKKPVAALVFFFLHMFLFFLLCVSVGVCECPSSCLAASVSVWLPLSLSGFCLICWLLADSCFSQILIDCYLSRPELGVMLDWNQCSCYQSCFISFNTEF